MIGPLVVTFLIFWIVALLVRVGGSVVSRLVLGVNWPSAGVMLIILFFVLAGVIASRMAVVP